MDKTFFFMAGLPRSGSTLLSAILNQNPDIYSSPQTDLLQMMYLLDINMTGFESYRAGINHDGYSNALNKLGHSFYEQRSQPFIIDKNRAWGTPYNLNLAKLLNPDVRILLPYRPILEILTSFIVLAEKNPQINFIDGGLREDDFLPLNYRTLNEARCEWLMRPKGQIDFSILSLAESKKNPTNFLLLEYKQIVNQTKEVIDSVYDFLNLTPYKHNLKKINQKDTHDFDAQVFGIGSLHTIRSKIKNTSRSPESVLSSFTIKKYAQTLDFLND